MKIECKGNKSHLDESGYQDERNRDDYKRAGFNKMDDDE